MRFGHGDTALWQNLTQNTKLSTLTQNKNTSTWPANKSPAMCKTGHEHAANEKIHKPCVHTRHDKGKNAANEKHKLHATEHTRTEATCSRKTKTQNTRGQKSVQPSELKTAHSHNETEHGARVSEPRHKTETQDMSAGIRTPRSNMKQGTQMRERTDRTTLDRIDRTLTPSCYSKPVRYSFIFKQINTN